MNQTMERDESKAAPRGGCPWHRPSPAPLSADSALELPMNQRMVAQYITDEASGLPQLHLFHGTQEICFDEPELFGFGETLARQSRFRAGSVMDWGTGCDWPRLRELLAQLVDGGVLRLAADEEPAPVRRGDDGARPSPLPPAPSATPRTWFECEALTQALAGRALEIGHLELVVPVFRIAHMALDGDGRQVGEANVFPQPLRLEVPTRWRTCIYPGSRFRDAKPMNVSALKAMRAHWPQVMTLLQRLREGYLQRFPAARGGWTVAEVERLATLVLALPTYQLMREHGRVANGELHPVLSALFRVTDGLRMTTHHMLFVPVAEESWSPDTPVTSREIHAYAERSFAFHSSQGVCAGPRTMIDEFLGVLLDGVAVAPVALPPAVETALQSLDAAFDYCLLGLRAHAVVFSLWPAMTRSYQQLWDIVAGWPDTGPGDGASAGLRQHLAGRIETLKNETMHATEAWRANRERAYAHIDRHCALALDGDAGTPLRERLAAAAALPDAELAASLQACLAHSLPDAPPAGLQRIQALLQAYFQQCRAILGLAESIQARINTLLARTQPQRPFSAADIDIHIRLQGAEARRLPQLIDELERWLGFRAEVTPAHIRIEPRMPGG